MKYLKNHLMLIFSLVALLGSYQFYLTIVDLTSSYEKKLAKEYSIVAAAAHKIEERVFKDKSSLIASAEIINAEPFFAEFSDDLSPEVYEQLKTSLPIFYRLKLTRYPTKAELEDVCDSVRTAQDVVKVENFAMAQSSISTLLNGLKSATALYLAVIFIFNVLLFIKFMEVWSFEHISRMQIMAIFGAPAWMRSATLIKTAVMDSLAATIITVAMFYYISISPESVSYLKSIGIDGKIYFYPLESFLHLGGMALSVSLFSVLMVAFRRRMP